MSFKAIIDHNTNSHYAELAKTALLQVESIQSANDSLPASGSIPLSMTVQKIMTPALINGVPMEMALDSGSDPVVLSPHLLRDLHLSLGAPDSYYKETGQKIWHAKVDITVGSIARHNFPVVLMESLEKADRRNGITRPYRFPEFPGFHLLGNSFFKGYNHNLDLNAQVLTFSKPGLSLKDGGVVPPGDAVQIKAKVEGKNILLPVRLNGHEVDAIFDSGAYDNVSVTDEICLKNGISMGPYVPREKQDWVGTSHCKLQIGSINIGDVKMVIWNSKCALYGHEYPVIGPFIPQLREFEFFWDGQRQIMSIVQRSSKEAQTNLRALEEKRYQAFKNSFYQSAQEQHLKYLEKMSLTASEENRAPLQAYLSFLNFHASNLLGHGESERAASEFAKIVQINDKSGALDAETATSALGKYIKALEQLSKKDELDKLKARLNDMQRAAKVEKWQRTVKEHPEVATYHVGYGQALELIGKSEEARTEYGAAIKIDPNNEEAKRLLLNLGKK